MIGYALDLRDGSRAVVNGVIGLRLCGYLVGDGGSVFAVIEESEALDPDAFRVAYRALGGAVKCLSSGFCLYSDSGIA